MRGTGDLAGIMLFALRFFFRKRAALEAWSQPMLANEIGTNWLLGNYTSFARRSDGPS